MSEYALQTEALGVSFGRLRAVDEVSLRVKSGELRVLLGANGAGKTTLMDMISGRTRPSSGRVYLKGRDVTGLRDYQIARAGLGRKFQIPSVFGGLSVRQNLEVAAAPSKHIWANLQLKERKETAQAIEETLELVGLSECRSVEAATLSHGQTQWLELGMLMRQSPSVILLDEPTAGMTQAETAKTAAIINRLKGRHTLLVVEHDMAFVRDIAEKITVLHLGKILAEGSVAEIEANSAVRAAYLGTQEISAC